MNLPELSHQSSLALAFVLGALHVLEPAHGRSIINALLVGSRGSHSDVFRFGGAVVLSHLGVAALLAIGAWWLGESVAEGTLGPTVQVIGGVLTLIIGIVMLTCGIGRHTTCMHKHHGVEDHHDPEHEELHAQHMLQAHLLNPTVLGVTGGLIPCQGTIALIALSVGSGKLGAAIWLLVSFALGLGLCLLAVGLLTASAASRAERISTKLGSSTALALAPGAVVILMALVSLAFTFFGGHEAH